MEQPFSTMHVPQNKREARALALLGEQALPVLAYQQSRDVHLQEHCIHALSFIGTNAALDLLVGYTDDQRSQVKKALWKAWKRFDPQSYATRILSHIQQIKIRTPCDPLLLRNLQYLPHLQALHLRDSYLLHDASFLLTLPQLTTLTVDSPYFLDAHIVSKLTHLRILGVNIDGVSSLSSDLHWLTPLAQLTTLICRLSAKDLSPLAGLTQLRKLFFLSLSGAEDLHPLTGLTELRALALVGPIKSLQPLANLTNLRFLSIASPQLEDVQPLANLTNLRSLDISGTRVKDLDPLTRCSQLRWLNLTSTSVRDLSPLVHLPALQGVQVSEPSNHLHIPPSLKHKIGLVKPLRRRGHGRIWTGDFLSTRDPLQYNSPTYPY